MNIYVGNLAFEVTEQELKETFGQFGSVVSAKVISDQQTGRSRGFGFVEMESKEAGNEAIEKLNGAELKGRNLVVNEARPKTDRGDRGGRGGYGGGGGGGRGGRGGRGGGGGGRGGYGGGDRY